MAVRTVFFSSISTSEVLPRQKVTELIYRHDLRQLRKSVVDYLELKGKVWVLFDNIDKGGQHMASMSQI